MNDDDLRHLPPELRKEIEETGDRVDKLAQVIYDLIRDELNDPKMSNRMRFDTVVSLFALLLHTFNSLNPNLIPMLFMLIANTQDVGDDIATHARDQVADQLKERAKRILH